MNPKDNKIVFDEYLGTPNRGVGLTWSDDKESTTFSLVKSFDITSQFEIPLTSTAAFTAVPQVENSVMILANMAEGNGSAVHAFTVNDESSKIIISNVSTGTRADKLEISNVAQTFIGMGLDMNSQELTIWEIEEADDHYEFTVVHTVKGVTDFSHVVNGLNIYIYFLGNQSPNANLVTLKVTSSKMIDVSKETPIPFDNKKSYWLSNVSCTGKVNKLGVLCAFNTFGTVIYVSEIRYPPSADYSAVDLTVFEIYEKLAGFDGSDLFIDESYLVQKAWHLKSGGFSLVANVWCRDTHNSDLHTQVSINQGPHMIPVIEKVRAQLLSGKKLANLDRRELKSAANDMGTFAMSYYFNTDL